MHTFPPHFTVLKKDISPEAWKPGAERQAAKLPCHFVVQDAALADSQLCRSLPWTWRLTVCLEIMVQMNHQLHCGSGNPPPRPPALPETATHSPTKCGSGGFSWLGDPPAGRDPTAAGKGPGPIVGGRGFVSYINIHYSSPSPSQSPPFSGAYNPTPAPTSDPSPTVSDPRNPYRT